MDKLLKRNVNEILENGNMAIVNMNGCKLMVFENGDVYRF